MNALEQIIFEEIRTKGDMSVADYMQHCLQHPEHGYYRQAQAVGAAGDFTTAPEISQIFGDLLGLWVLDMAQKQPTDAPIALVELGAGRGTLMADIMRMVAKLPALAARIEIHLVESNQTLKAQQKQALAGYAVQWHGEVESLPKVLPLIIVANEFFDALPVHQYCGEIERKVTIAEGKLAFTPSTPVTAEKSADGEAIIASLSQRIHAQGGAMLAIDYGYDEKRGGFLKIDSGEIDSEPQNYDTLQALKQHQFVDAMQDCGEADLTTHVDFHGLRESANAQGLQVHGTVTQAAFLQRLGGDIWLQKLLSKASSAEEKKSIEDGWLRLISPSQMGSLFKVMAFIASDEPPAGF